MFMTRLTHLLQPDYVYNLITTTTCLTRLDTWIQWDMLELHDFTCVSGLWWMFLYE